MADSPLEDPAIKKVFRIRQDNDTPREREAYKYYRPLEQLRNTANPPAASSISPTPRPPPKPPVLLPSLDHALNAFAQLGCLRLNCRRGLISLLDRHYQYILTEATRTMSLPGGATNDPKDDLHFGATQLTRYGTACCEYTAGLVPLQPGGLHFLPSDELLVIPDLATDWRFKDDPLVCGKPFARFYVGVPIISPDNYAIGAYCLLDDKPRCRLSDTDVAFIKDMAATVICHLDLIWTKAELSRSRDMVAGLGSFIGGKSSTHSWWRPPGDVSSLGDRYNLSPSAAAWDYQSTPNSPAGSLTAAPTLSVIEHVGIEPETRANDKLQPYLQPDDYQHGDPSSDSEDFSKYGSTPVDQGEFTQGNTLQEESLSTDTRETFTRAANIIREAVDLDGVIFFDASVGTFGGLVREETRPGLASGTSETGTYSTGINSQPSTPRTENLVGDKTCLVLGKALVKQKEEDGMEPCDLRSFTESILQSLLARYPRGKVWNYDEDLTWPTTPSQPTSLGDGDHLNRKGKRWKERKLLQSLFPGVQSLAFIGMRNSSRERWFSGSILWTRSRTRVLSAEVELNYLVAFGQSIMSEVAASDVRQADRAKGAFISSVSHELRTPLHGILGSTDCLQNTILDGVQQGLVDTIDTCSKTLLETFDSLLSYTKINYMTDFKGKHSSASPRKTEEIKAGAIGPQEDVSIGILVEEVVETVFAGQEYLRIGSRQLEEQNTGTLATAGGAEIPFNGFTKRVSHGLDAINVFVSYPKPESLQWNVLTRSGAWRRILLNLVGNALKYTERGFISVSLMASPISDDENRIQITLSIADSGKGMSQDFAVSKLFTPFVQENPLSPGTGLGMSIVKQIVGAMSGQISVMSKQNEGTVVKVTVPLSRSEKVSKAALIHTLSKRCQGTYLKICHAAISSNGPEDAVWAFTEICKQFPGLIVDPEDDPGGNYIYVSSDKHIRSLAGRYSDFFPMADPQSRRALIVICKDSASARVLKSLRVATTCFSMVRCISQPMGPNKIANAISPIFDYFDTPLDGGPASNYSLLATSKSTRVFPIDAPRNNATIEPTSKPWRVLPPSSNSPDIMDDKTAFSSSPVSPLSLCPDPEIGAVLNPRSSETRVTTRTLLNTVSGESESKALYSVISNDSTSASQQVLAEPLKIIQAPTYLEISPPRASVLLVDDNAVNLRLLSTYMLKQNRVYSLAENGLEAFERYCSGVPSTVKQSRELAKNFTAYDYVFMDLNMPVLDGLEATRRIRGFECDVGLKPAKIIAITGMATAAARQEAFASGIDVFMTKPVRLKEIAPLMEKT